MTDQAAVPAPPRSRWYHGVWFVLLMLFVVLGPFGLPWLWKSPRFARAIKIALTILVLLYTVWIVAASVKLVTGMLNELQTMPSLR